MSRSSFRYHQIFPGNTVLVFIPHEDDEVNVAGATIYGAKKEGFRVICVFAANGDRSYTAGTRIRETEACLGKLGVPPEDIVFLGYPDGGLDAARCVYMHGQKKIMTVDGHSETYGIEGRPEFCMKENGFHRSYTWEGFLADLEQVIEKYRPDTIIGIDFDSHPDHRMCSMAIEMVLGHILNNKENAYYPLVLKAFAYNTAFESFKDFYAPNLLSTRFSRRLIMDPAYETDNPVYEWEQRIRLPAAEACRRPLLWNNVIFQALRGHLSQRAMLKAERIINGDQVFWQRRTKNLAMKGKISVSSGDPKYLHDFQMIHTNDIVPKHGVKMSEYLWKPDKKDGAPWCRCNFDVPQHVEAVYFYGNIDKESRVGKGRLIFSNGYKCEVSDLRQDGHETAVQFPPQGHVEWIEYQMLEREGLNPGISEWEILPSKKEEVRILQILADGNFIYDWKMAPGNTAPVISAYTCGLEKEKLIWFWNGQAMPLEDINRHCRNMRNQGIIRVEVGEGADALWAEASIRRISKFDAWRKNLFMLLDHSRVWLEKQRIKRKHHQLRLLKRKERELAEKK